MAIATTPADRAKHLVKKKKPAGILDHEQPPSTAFGSANEQPPQAKTNFNWTGPDGLKYRDRRHYLAENGLS